MAIQVTEVRFEQSLKPETFEAVEGMVTDLRLLQELKPLTSSTPSAMVTVSKFSQRMKSLYCNFLTEPGTYTSLRAGKL